MGIPGHTFAKDIEIMSGKILVVVKVYYASLSNPDQVAMATVLHERQAYVNVNAVLVGLSKRW